MNEASAEHMGEASAEHVSTSAMVTVRYWAAARAAAGIESEQVGAGTLASVLDEIDRRHRDRDRFADVVGTCSILVGETPVGAREPDSVPLVGGDTVELLPPFAGG